METIPLISTTGPAAEGENRFFPRPNITKKIKRKLSNKENLLISAPRRIGKTSILKDMRDNHDEDEIVKYIIVQSVSSSEEFFKKLFNELIKDERIFGGISHYLKNASAAIGRYVSRVKGISIDGTVEFSSGDNICYQDELFRLIEELLTHPKKIILFIDEFPDAVNNIFEIEREKAVQFLQQHRELRERYSNSNIQFVYTGSTGLKNVVRKIGEIHLINNLVEVKIPPLSKSEGRMLIQRLILGKKQELENFGIPDATVDYMLSKIKWLLPYYIQIIVDELFEYFENTREVINNHSIDKVLSELVKANSNHSDYFENWKSRLAKSFSPLEKKLALDVLNHISKEGEILYSEYYDFSQKYEVEDEKFVIEVLQHDGYIHEDAGSGKKYGFNSVLLKEWWYINVAT